MLSFHDQEVSSWHNSEISARTPDVRFRGQSGKHLLATSISSFDPKQKPSVQSSLMNHLFCDPD
jgi:hypothetical protein